MDLMLLHWPNGGREKRLAAWQVLEKLYERGWARAIGVSNFSIGHMEQLQQDGATIVPMVNQIEASVTLQYTDIVEYCKSNNIVPMAFSPFGRGVKELPEELQDLASKYDKNVGQIAIKYLLQIGYVVTYLSNSKSHIVSNQNVFDFTLTTKEMDLIHGLNRPDGGWGLPSPNEIE